MSEKRKPTRRDAIVRTLYQGVALPANEVIVQHENKDIVVLEIERLEGECRTGFTDGRGKRQRICHEGIPVTHELREQHLACSDDPTNTLPPATGPIVSTQAVTAASLKRGVKPPDPLIRV